MTEAMRDGLMSRRGVWRPRTYSSGVFKLTASVLTPDEHCIFVACEDCTRLPTPS